MLSRAAQFYRSSLFSMEIALPRRLWMGIEQLFLLLFFFSSGTVRERRGKEFQRWRGSYMCVYLCLPREFGVVRAAVIFCITLQLFN